jgi:hypothetical protein
MRSEPLPETDPIAEPTADPLDTDTVKFKRKVQLDFTAEVVGAQPLKSALYVSVEDADDPEIVHALTQEHIDTYVAALSAAPVEEPEPEATLEVTAEDGTVISV